MGLSTKQVYGEHGLDWSQTLLESGALELPKLPPVRRQQSQQQQSEPVACPRCGSINTKFCYYNNYNKSQPRHFCKACKRHWTKGGTLRNVPVGGARKNKRLKTSNSTTTTTTTAAVAAATATTTTMTESTNTHTSTVQSQQQCQNVPLTLGDQKNSSEILYQALLRPPSSSQYDAINSFRGKSISGINGIFKGSTFSASQSQNLHFPFSRLSSINTDPSPLSASFQPSSGYNSGGGLETMEDSTINTVMPSASSINISQPWQVPPTSTVMDMPNYWNWDDIDTLVATDLNIPWDDSEIKP